MVQDQELLSDAAAAFASWSHQGSTRNSIFDQINWGYKVGICTFWKKSNCLCYHNGPNRLFNIHIQTEIRIHKNGSV